MKNYFYTVLYMWGVCVCVCVFNIYFGCNFPSGCTGLRVLERGKLRTSSILALHVDKNQICYTAIDIQ